MTAGRAALLAMLASAVLAASAAARTLTDPRQAWQDYLHSGAAAEPRYRFPHSNCFRAAALAHELPETLLLAVARGESDFDARARSKANAHGVMQILWPDTAKHLGIFRLSDLYDPCTNIDAGARYLRELLQHYDGDLHLALAAYNYGPGRIPQRANIIPEGAAWYSAYIYRHLDYVVGDRPGSNVPSSLYSELGRTPLLSFGEPYRAAAFIEGMEAKAPDVRLDWFRRGTGRFEVILTYENKDDYDASASRLTRAGFPIR